jgi:hypothetical protein
MNDPDIELNGQSLRLTHGELTRRAQAWTVEQRLNKMTEECAEFIAAARRYLREPTAYHREKLAEEMVGVENTLRAAHPEFADDCDSVRPRQALRLRSALERDGL